MMKFKTKSAFTLVELLIVLAILSLLVSIALVSFRSSQARGRDAQKKSNLKQISSSLELFFSDYGKYPDDNGGKISACPFNSGTNSGTDCDWGKGEFTDSKTTYFKVLPSDPNGSYFYYYRIVDSPTNQKYQLFSYIENSKDKDCLEGDCANSPVSYQCGTGINCNFAITSPNTTPTE